jgi:ADP-ribosylglycohydrolase/protein-tyrosine phosphatase
MSSQSQPVLRDRLAGGLVGLLVGDALGVPYEFHPPVDLPPPDQIEFNPPKGFRRSHVGVPPGTWSDDGAHALVLLDSLLAKDGLDLAHLGDGIRRWLHEGRYAVGGMVFDIGIQTSSAINNLVNGIPAERAGPAEESRNGNGSLMRVLPLALWHSGDDAELIQLAARQSLPTHGHPRSQVACAFYCLWARAVLNDAKDPWALAAHQLRTLSPAGLFPEQEIELVLNPANAKAASGSGYVVDCLWSARLAVDETDSYEACVKRAIAFGHDTDTTAAVAGGIAGLRHGLQGIPQRWRQELRGDTLYRPLLDRLFDHRMPVKKTNTLARTSESHPLQIATLPAGAGRLGVTFCPGKKQSDALSGSWDRDLEADLLAVKQWGAKHLVTLIEEHEFVQLQVEDLPERAALMGLRWHHLPIVDGQAPDRQFERLWQAVAPQLIRSLKDGAGVIVHCKGGLGRAGTVAARLLMSLDASLTPSEAIASVRAVRANAIETRAQENYLLGLNLPA